MTDKNKQLYLDFEAYERVAEPHKRERASAWRTAIGLPQFGITECLIQYKYSVNTPPPHTIRSG